MLQPGGDLDFMQEPLGAERRRELRVEDLDGYRSMVFQVFGEEHGCHAPPTQFPLDRVAVSEGLTHGVEGILHGTWELAYNALQPPASVAAPPPPLFSCRGSFPICSGRMTHPASVRPSPVPSISRLFMPMSGGAHVEETSRNRRCRKREGRLEGAALFTSVGRRFVVGAGPSGLLPDALTVAAAFQARALRPVTDLEGEGPEGRQGSAFGGNSATRCEPTVGANLHAEDTGRGS